MIPIPISAARAIADDYGYDQVVIIARKVGDHPAPNGEHITTDGVTRQHADVAAAAGRALQRFMRWPLDPEADPVVAALQTAIKALRGYQYGAEDTAVAADAADRGDAALIAVGLPPATLPGEWS